MTLESEFLRFSVEKLRESMERIETCVAKLTPEQAWARGSESENAIGNLLLHLNGNVRQWILSGVSGEPDHRERSAEFAAREGTPAEDLVSRLRETVDAALDVIRRLPHEELMKRTGAQGYDVTKLEAIFHVVEHFVGHTFQIIFATKLLTREDLGFYAYLNKTGRADAGGNP